MLKPALRSPSSFAGALRAQRTGSKFRLYAVISVATIPQRPYKFARDAAQSGFAPFRLKRFIQAMQDVSASTVLHRSSKLTDYRVFVRAPYDLSVPSYSGDPLILTS